MRIMLNREIFDPEISQNNLAERQHVIDKQGKQEVGLLRSRIGTAQSRVLVKRKSITGFVNRS